MTILPGQVLEPDAKTRTTLGIELNQIVDDFETEYAPLFRAIKTWWKWYEAEPRTKQRDFPFKGASNIVVPLTQITSDALVSRAMTNIFGHGRRVWAVETENTDNETQAMDMSRFLNWAARGNDFNFKFAIYDWLMELYPIGSSVLAFNYRNDVRPMFFGQSTQDRTAAKHRMVSIRRGVNFEHVPRESILWDTRVPIADAPIVIREHSFTWSQLKMFALTDTSGAWDKEAIESVQGNGGETFSGSFDVRRSKNESDKRSRDDIRNATEDHDVREIHADWPILGAMGFEVPGKEDMGAPDLPVVAYVHRHTDKVLRLTAEPYNLTGKPFFDGYFRKRSGRGMSVGIAKKLEHMQAMSTTLFNQAIDAQTRANAVWAITRNPRFLKEPLDISKPIYAQGMLEEFNVLGIPANPGPELALMQAGQVMAERLTGIADPNLGRETRSGGHPSPATSTLALLEQGNIMSAATDMLVLERISEMGEAALIGYQQFETDEDGRLNRVLGELDGESVKEILFPQGPIPGHFNVRALSPSLNPEGEMQKAITISQVDLQYWVYIQRGVQVVNDPNAPPELKQVWKQSMKAKTKLYRRFLDGADVDDMEVFLARIEQFGAQTQQALGAAGGIGEIAAGNGAPAQGGPGIPQGGPAPGANGASPPLGLFQ